MQVRRPGEGRTINLGTFETPEVRGEQGTAVLRGGRRREEERRSEGAKERRREEGRKGGRGRAGACGSGCQRERGLG
eukprot:503426-Rhodomonas_salina.1